MSDKISPADPGQEGSKETLHDGMNDAGHEEQKSHAEGNDGDDDEK